MVLYHGRYYLYFGAAPALVVFAPWRLLTGHDLPQHLGGVVLCFGGFLFSCGALLRVLDRAKIAPGSVLLVFLFLALGLCTPVPFLLNRASVYELAIAGGYFSLSGAIFFLARGQMAASGLMFALAVASRPHLAFAGLIALVALAIVEWRKRPRAVLAFFAAWAIGGASIALYNYERFGNPLEFGFRYQLAGAGQNRVEIATRNLVPGAYFMLLSRPEFSPVFPWMRMVFRFPFDSAEEHPLPPEYFIEPSVGALWTTPLLLAAFWPRRNLIVAIAAAAGTATLLFLISTHLQTHRYEGDFVPLLVLAALFNLALARRRAVAVAACALIAYCAAANLAMGLAGPYEDFLKSEPATYVRLASRFSSGSDNRLQLNPPIHVRLSARFVDAGVGYRDPLVTIGHSHYNHFLFAERAADGIALVSKTYESEAKLPVPTALLNPLRVDLRYVPERGDIMVSVEGGGSMVHHVGQLVAAPASVVTGSNLADLGMTARKFLGPLEVLEKSVGR
jgi:hypothetical protein